MGTNGHAFQIYADDGEAVARAERVKSVCYRCRFVGVSGGAMRCPKCAFPLILESLASGPDDEDESSVERIVDRPEVGSGAPLLPGVDGAPRQAQILAENRKRRRTADLEAAAAAARTGAHRGADARVADAAAPGPATRKHARAGTGVSLNDQRRSRLGGVVLGTLILAGAAILGAAIAVL